MTRSAGIRAFFAAAALFVPVAGCGGDDDVGDPIPASTAGALEQQLDAIQAEVRQGDCDGVTTAIAELQTDVDGLDDQGVGRDVQDAIGDGVDNLSSLAAQECEPEEPVETVPETVPEETITETTPEPTTPQPTTPEPTSPEPTTPEPTTPEPTPDETDGGAQFDPNADAPGKQKKDGD